MANGPAQKLRSLKWELLVTGMLLIIFGLVLRHQAPKIPALLCVGPACGITPIWTLAVAGGIVVAALAAIRKLRACLLAAILVVLLLVIEIDRFLPNLDPGVSARDAVRVASNVWPEFNPRNAASLQLSRSYLYQLSFYARVEIPEYKVGGVNSTWLFVPKGKQAEAANLGFHCVNFAVDPAVIPCQLAPSVGAFGGSLGSGSAGSHGDHR